MNSRHTPDRRDGLPAAARSNRCPAWVLPAAMLVTLGVASSLVVYRLSGGAEIADDAAKLIRFARLPFVLWGDYRAMGVWDTWGSFPPLLPLFFGVVVAPWLALTGSDFWGIRLGILSWSVIVLIAVHLVMKSEAAASPRTRRSVLLLFALLPSVLGAIAFIPQEEIYVSIYCLVLYALAKRAKWRLLPFALILAFFAGKYYLLALAVPLAFASPRPVRNFALWTGTIAALLAAYVFYHHALHGLTPVVTYAMDPRWSISVWGLVWNTAGHVDPQIARLLPLPLLFAAIVAFGVAARRRGLSLAFSMAGTLYITLLGLSATGPAYVLWVVPLVLICLTRMKSTRHRFATVGLLFLWGAGEWGANLFRGVKLALDTERAGGKTAIASAAERVLGADFPYHALHLACLVIVIACGLCQLYVLWQEGKNGGGHGKPAAHTAS